MLPCHRGHSIVGEKRVRNLQQVGLAKIQQSFRVCRGFDIEVLGPYDGWIPLPRIGTNQGVEITYNDWCFTPASRSAHGVMHLLVKTIHLLVSWTQGGRITMNEIRVRNLQLTALAKVKPTNLSSFISQERPMLAWRTFRHRPQFARHTHFDTLVPLDGQRVLNRLQLVLKWFLIR